MEQEIERLKKQKDQAYWERNQLVAALSKIFPAQLTKHPESDKDWDDDWRTIVVIELPAECNREFAHVQNRPVKDEQLTWHIHDSDIPMFDHLRYSRFEWDGHSTEEKYRRLRKLIHGRYELVQSQDQP